MHEKGILPTFVPILQARVLSTWCRHEASETGKSHCYMGYPVQRWCKKQANDHDGSSVNIYNTIINLGKIRLIANEQK